MFADDLRRAARIALLAGIGLPVVASAAEPPAYRDDRSTAEAVVTSLYNAIARREYARAWSYFGEGAAAPFAKFAAGYAGTDGVRIRLGATRSEGAAGSIFFTVPVAVEAASGDKRDVFTGCYELRLVQPAAQIVPPFTPIHIVKGRLEPFEGVFEAANGTCPEGGLR